jgi:hypothetical protein
MKLMEGQTPSLNNRTGENKIKTRNSGLLAVDDGAQTKEDLRLFPSLHCQQINVDLEWGGGVWMASLVFVDPTHLFTVVQLRRKVQVLVQRCQVRAARHHLAVRLRVWKSKKGGK